MLNGGQWQGMKNTLYLKFAILYLIFGFASMFTAATLSEGLIRNRFTNDSAQTLFRSASAVAANYLPAYFTNDISGNELSAQFDTMSIYLNSHIWFVDHEGNMISSSARAGSNPPEFIENFNPAEIGANNFIRSYYHGYFNEEVITVIAPVTRGFDINGYLIIHMPTSVINRQTSNLMLYLYITIGIVILLSLLMLFGFHFLIYSPLKIIKEAATHYSTGNLDYDIPVDSNDEMGYLSSSLNYMATQLKDMEDYQKQIVANISHDFRSPLTSIKGYVEAMADGTIPLEQHERYLAIILSETNRLTNLTVDLLTLNEIDSKEAFLNKSDFDIQNAIRQVAETFEVFCTKKRITIELLLLPEIIYVNADRGKIQQVLHNLIDNAIKFSDFDSTITIEVRSRYEKIYVSIKDYGMGIPQKEINKIWERFYKSDLSRGIDKKGTGLGLAIVKEIIQSHNEHINVVSTQGVGTEFIFSLNLSIND